MNARQLSVWYLCSTSCIVDATQLVAPFARPDTYALATRIPEGQ